MSRGFMGLSAGLLFAFGCSGPATAPSANSGTAKPQPLSTPVADAKRPKFESELIITRKAADGSPAGTSSHKSTRYDDGKSFTAVENVTSTLKEGPTKTSYEVVFVAHREGKDVYRLKYTIEKTKGSETKSNEAAYDGKKLVLLDDQHGTVVLQPPVK